MDLCLSPEQQLLVDSARGFLTRACPIALVRRMEHDTAGYDRALWREMAGLGWLHGDGEGSGLSFFDLVLLLEEMGRVLLPAPFMQTVAVAMPLLAAKPSLRTGELIAAGELVAALGVLDHGHDEWPVTTLRAETRAGGVALDGRKCFVAYAGCADLIVLPARRADGVIVLAVIEPGAAGVTCVKRATLSGEPLFDVLASQVRVPHRYIVATGAAAEALMVSARDRAAVASLAFLVGAAERVLEMTVDYAKTRTQFGRPIGSFQATAHRCADMRSEIDAVRLLVYQAAWSMSQAGDPSLAVSAAKAGGNEALRRIFMHAHQVHGAIGFSTEHDLHLFTRRAKAGELQWGSTARHLDRVATAMGL